MVHFCTPDALPSRRNPSANRVWSVGRFLVLLAALVATFGMFFLAGLRVTTRAREVEVPDLRGKSATEAKAMLGGLGLAMRIDETRKPDKNRADRSRAGTGPGRGTGRPQAARGTRAG